MTINKLKNNENFNISEGNVKEDNIFSNDYVKKSHNKQTLTELWKKGKLPKGYYYAEDDGEELIIHIQGQNGSVMGDDFDLKATDWIKPIAPVPSYEEWQPFTDPYFRGLTTKHIAELAKKSIRLTTQHCEDNEEIEILREQLDLKNDMVDKLIRENESLKKWCEEFNALDVAEENQQLKELLKRARDSLEGVICCVA